MIGGRGSGRKGENPKNERTFRRLATAQRRREEAEAESRTAKAAKKAFADKQKNDKK